jgi:hypothetical protein
MKNTIGVALLAVLLFLSMFMVLLLYLFEQHALQVSMTNELFYQQNHDNING